MIKESYISDIIIHDNYILWLYDMMDRKKLDPPILHLTCLTGPKL